MRRYFLSVAPERVVRLWNRTRSSDVQLAPEGLTIGRSSSVAARAEGTWSLPSASSTPDEESHRRLWYSDAITVFALALGLRLVFSLLISNTFDRDEFVYLSLGHAVGNGTVPYRDFPFFHPPGILVLIGSLNSITALWWPLARLADVLIDTVTAVLIWRIGAQLYGRQAAFMAGALYAVNPLVLVSAVRVNGEILITALGIAGLTLLLTRSSYRSAFVAGVCLAAAFWIKYPAIIFLPVYLVAAPRRSAATILGFLTAGIALFLPYRGLARLMFDQTVTWQTAHRHVTPVPIRLGVAAVAWFGVSAIGVVALFRRRNPWWLMLGFAGGGFFLLTATTYGHYFVPVAPYGALLGAPIAAAAVRLARPVLFAACLALIGVWAALVLSPVSRRITPSWTFGAIKPVVQLIDCATPPGTPVLANGSEFTYLAARPPVAHYFWEYYRLTTVRALKEQLPAKRMIVLYPKSNYEAFPIGFTSYLDSTYIKFDVAGAAVWVNQAIARNLNVRTASCRPH